MSPHYMVYTLNGIYASKHFRTRADCDAFIKVSREGKHEFKVIEVRDLGKAAAFQRVKL